MCMQNCGMTKKEFEEITETYNNMVANGVHLQVGDPVYKKFKILQEKIVKYKTNHNVLEVYGQFY